MAKSPASKPSFSFRQRWSIFFSVIVSIAAMSALIVMINYLGARYYLRFPWSMQTRKQLASQTVNLLRSITNDVNVVIYYDKEDLLYDNVKDLLNEYRLTNPKISVRTVDYLKDAGDALKVKETYANFMGPGAETNLVIFNTTNGTFVVTREKLAQYVIEPMASETGREYRNKLEAFLGEEEFDHALLHVLNSRPPRAYFLETLNSEHHLDGQDIYGYQKFKSLLQGQNIDVTDIASLGGSNGVPPDCRLLIIAGPTVLAPSEIAGVRRYLDQGGRLFVLFNYLSLQFNTGLEAALGDWGIAVGRNTVRDLKNHSDDTGNDVVVNSFSKVQPIMRHLSESMLELALPRSIATNANSQGSSAHELAWTGSSAVINDSPSITGKPVPLMAAIEKGDVKGITDQGTTRIVVVGDSFFLDNQMIGAADNRYFAGYAINWLLGQGQMLQGVAPQHIQEYKLMVTSDQAENIRWILLGAMPGGILFVGGLVWLRRRR